MALAMTPMSRCQLALGIWQRVACPWGSIKGLFLAKCLQRLASHREYREKQGNCGRATKVPNVMPRQGVCGGSGCGEAAQWCHWCGWGSRSDTYWMMPFGTFVSAARPVSATCVRPPSPDFFDERLRRYGNRISTCSPAACWTPGIPNYPPPPPPLMMKPHHQ